MNSPYPESPGYRRGSSTSKQAAEKIGGAAGSLRARILELVRGAPEGLSTEGIAESIGIEFHIAHPRVAELHTSGFIRNSGRTQRNRTTGKLNSIWEAVENPVRRQSRKSRNHELESLLRDILTSFEREPLRWGGYIDRITHILNKKGQ